MALSCGRYSQSVNEDYFSIYETGKKQKPILAQSTTEVTRPE